MMPRSLLMVGLVALVIALAATGALSVLRADEVVEVFPLPADILDLPLPTEAPHEMATVSPQATAVPVVTSVSGSPGKEVSASTAVLQAGQNGYSGCTDTYIQFYLPTDNYCQSPELFLVTSNKAATLLRFDLTNLPEQVAGLNPDATILEATLELYTVQGNEGVRIGIYVPNQSWDPCTVTWKSPWAQPGADGLSDREDDPWAEATVKQAEGWMAFDITSLVQHWLGDPTKNLGMILKSFDVNVPSHHVFRSSEHPDGDTRPRLTIKFQAALPAATLAPVPTLTATAIPDATPTASPASTVAPMLTPTLITPISPRVLELHWRNDMDVGSSYPIQAIFRPETAGGTSESAQIYKLSVQAQVTAPTFDILDRSPAEQMLDEPEGVLSWSWEVEPRVIGAQTLALDLLFSWAPAASASPGVTMDRGAWYQTKVIKVVKPFPYWTHITLLRNVLLFVGLACIVGWYVLRRRTKDRSASSA